MFLQRTGDERNKTIFLKRKFPPKNSTYIFSFFYDLHYNFVRLHKQHFLIHSPGHACAVSIEVQNFISHYYYYYHPSLHWALSTTLTMQLLQTLDFLFWPEVQPLWAPTETKENVSRRRRIDLCSSPNTTGREVVVLKRLTHKKTRSQALLISVWLFILQRF